jgi:hypothetical protein
MKSDIVGICPEPDDTGFVRNNFPELIYPRMMQIHLLIG